MVCLCVCWRPSGYVYRLQVFFLLLILLFFPYFFFCVNVASFFFESEFSTFNFSIFITGIRTDKARRFNVVDS